jgi:hypothetical protein
MSGDPKRLMSKRTDGFTLTELRHMVAALRKHDVRELLAEFEAALDLRIKEKLGLEASPETVIDRSRIKKSD